MFDFDFESLDISTEAREGLILSLNLVEVISRRSWLYFLILVVIYRLVSSPIS